MKKILVILAVMMTAAVTFAQNVGNLNIVFEEGDLEVQEETVVKPPFWMISSPGALRAFALSEVRTGEVRVWGETLVNMSDSKHQATVGPKTGANNPSEIMSQMATESATLVFHIIDPRRDSVQRGGALVGQNGDWLFYGFEYDVKAFKFETNWRLPQSNIDLQMSDRIPVPVPQGTTGAKLLYRDSNGQVAWSEWNLGVWNGRTYFPTQYAGSQGQLVLQSSNGSTVINIGTGREIVPARIATNVGVNLPNFKHVSDKNLMANATEVLSFDMKAVWSDDPALAPVVWVNLSKYPHRYLKFKVWVQDDTSVVERPIIGQAINRFSGEFRQFSATQTLLPSGQLSEPEFNLYLDHAGDWVIWFDFEESFNQPPSPPYYGGSVGGKG